MVVATIAIAGSSGLIGSALATALRTADFRVLRIVRRAPANSSELHWDPDSGELDAGALGGVDAVVNMCGINVGRRRWSGAFKQNLRDSRITPTEVLSHAIAEAGVGVLVNASAVGYYGDTRAREIDEQAAAAGLELASVETFREGYADTLAEWRRRFEAAWPAIEALGFDAAFHRLWTYYLSYCEAGFRTGTIDVGLYVLKG